MHDTAAHRKPDRRCLYNRASEQRGYFTAAQARACGYSGQLLRYHARTGHMPRIGRGVYRLAEYPSSPTEDVMASWLRAGGHPGVVSHESAMEILRLSDVIPYAVHITIPRSRRYRTAPPGVALHTASRPPARSELVTIDGLPVTSVARTILDVAEAGLSPEQVIAAVCEAVRRGTVESETLLVSAQGRPERVRLLVKRALQEGGVR